MVLSWIITNFEPDLVNQFLDYNTTWDLWVGIKTLLGSERDELQIFDLSQKLRLLNKIKTPLRCTLEN